MLHHTNRGETRRRPPGDSENISPDVLGKRQREADSEGEDNLCLGPKKRP